MCGGFFSTVIYWSHSWYKYENEPQRKVICMERNAIWLDWAVELQALAQAGLHYGKDVYDRERYQRIRDIAADMLAHQAGLDADKVRAFFCCETGYQTPKLDTRAAVFQDEGILLVQEQSGLWSLPGGWVDVNLSVAESAVKEVKEEAGLDVIAQRIIAVQDWSRHNRRNNPFGICKVFFLCTATGGAFQPNSETTASGYFALDKLPPLSDDKTTEAQVAMCFEANRSPNWQALFD